MSVPPHPFASQTALARENATPFLFACTYTRETMGSKVMSNFPHAKGASSTSKRILIVEDDAELGDLLLEVLQDEATLPGVAGPKWRKSAQSLSNGHASVVFAGLSSPRDQWPGTCRPDSEMRGI